MRTKTTQFARKRAIETQQLLFDEDLTRAVLKLTASSVTSEQAVRDVLAPCTAGRLDIQEYESAQTKNQARAPTIYWADWELARQRLLDWCALVSRYDRLSDPDREKLRQRVNAIAKLQKYSFCVTGRGLALAVQMDTVMHMVTRALLPFLDPVYGWAPSRLFQCQLSTCKEWFLRPNRSGTAAMYCSAKHANLTRVWRSRGKTQ